MSRFNDRTLALLGIPDLPHGAFEHCGDKKIKPQGGGSGGGGGQQTSTQTSYQTNIPAYLEGPTQRMVARGETLSEQGYQPYTGERVAGFTPTQTAAFNELGGLGTPSQFGQAGQSVTGAQQFGTAGAIGAMGYQPTQFNQYQMSGPGAVGAGQVQGTGYDAYGVQAAPDVTGTAYQAAQAGYTPQWSAETAQSYMSPYQKAVTDIAKREATTDAAMLNRELAGKAAKAGAFGGSRFGVEQALLGSKLATNLSDIQTKGLESAYQSGMGQFNAEQAARQAINLANQGALNQAGQFGASQAQAAALANQQARQQANMASQQAYNQALQFGATQAQAAQIANQQANLTAAQSNQQMQYQTGLQNLQAALTTQQQQDAARRAGAELNLQGAQFGAQTGLSAAERLGQLGTASQAADLQRISAQQAAGAQQQALQQQKLDTAYQQATEQRDWEKNQLGFLSGLIRGTPFSTSQLQTQSAPGSSTASQLASIGLGAYGLSSLLGKKAGGAIKGYAGGGSVEGYAYGGDISSYPDQLLQAVVAGKSDDLPVDVAKQELSRRAKLRTAVQGVRAEEELASGIAGLEADNMEFADGGIIGYAAGGLPQGYDPAIYEMFEDPTSGEVYPRKKVGAMQAYGQRLQAKAQGKQAPVEEVVAVKPASTTPAVAPQVSRTGAAVAPTTRAPRAAAPAAAPAPAVPQMSPLEEKIYARMAETDKSNAAMMEELAKGQKDVEGIRGDIRGIAALRAAAAIAQGGPGGTLAQLGRGAGAFGEEAQRGEALMQSARQGLMGQRLQMAQLERAANSGDITALATLQQLKQQQPLQEAQTKQALAYAGYLGNKGSSLGGGSNLSELKFKQANLLAQLKALQGKVDPASKAEVTRIQRELAALGGGGGSQFITKPGSGSVVRSSLYGED